MQPTNSVHNKMYIFLVDDDNEDQEIFSDALSKVALEKELSVFDNAKALLEELRIGTNLPDVIFIDLYMPGIGGKECIRKIRNERTYDQIPIVIYSTSYDPNQIERLFELGANRFLQKPISFRELISSISEALQAVRKEGVSGDPVYDLVQDT